MFDMDTPLKQLIPKRISQPACLVRLENMHHLWQSLRLWLSSLSRSVSAAEIRSCWTQRTAQISNFCRNFEHIEKSIASKSWDVVFAKEPSCWIRSSQDTLPEKQCPQNWEPCLLGSHLVKWFMTPVNKSRTSLKSVGQAICHWYISPLTTVSIMVIHDLDDLGLPPWRNGKLQMCDECGTIQCVYIIYYTYPYN
jgi:hypothetical protein